MLCSHLVKNDDCKPYEPLEWSNLAEKLLNNKLQPKDIIFLSDSDFLEIGIGKEEKKRIENLIKRGSNLIFEFEKYQKAGISVVTRADAQYPRKLKLRLGKKCPPLFYYAGDLSLAENKSIGFAGSRNIDENDRKFTERTVCMVNSLNYTVVSGGAKGVDLIASKTSLHNGNASIEYIADSFLKRIRNRDVITAIQNKKLLIFSAVRPDMGFTTATAMMRNRYIYAQSEGTVIVRSDYKKGGTWNGALDCLKNKICTEYCWNNPTYKGNQELIKLGAVPIDFEWDGNLNFISESTNEPVQLSFDL